MSRIGLREIGIGLVIVCALMYFAGMGGSPVAWARDKWDSLAGGGGGAGYGQGGFEPMPDIMQEKMNNAIRGQQFRQTSRAIEDLRYGAPQPCKGRGCNFYHR